METIQESAGDCVAISSATPTGKGANAALASSRIQPDGQLLRRGARPLERGCGLGQGDQLASYKIGVPEAHRVVQDGNHRWLDAKYAYAAEIGRRQFSMLFGVLRYQHAQCFLCFHRIDDRLRASCH